MLQGLRHFLGSYPDNAAGEGCWPHGASAEAAQLAASIPVASRWRSIPPGRNMGRRDWPGDGKLGGEAAAGPRSDVALM